MGSKTILFFLLALLACPVSVLSAETKWLVKKDYFPKAETTSDYLAWTDLEVTPDKVFVVENFPGHQIVVLKNGGELLYAMGRKGKERGELIAPFKISHWRNEVVVSDNNGLAVFGTDGRFLRRLRPFISVISFVYVKGEIYIVSGTPGMKSLINVFTPAGRFAREFGQEFATLDYSLYKNWNPIGAKRFVYDGKLLSDGKYLYYLNYSFAKAIKLSLNGKKIEEAEIADVFGEEGKKQLESNVQTWFKDGFDIKQTQGAIPVGRLFEDACLCGPKIYLLSRKYRNDDQGRLIFEYAIKVLDKDTFRQVDEFRIKKNDDEGVMALKVEEVGQEPVFYFTMSRTGPTTVIAVYEREN
jgi:hypothetical protein